MSRQPVFKSPLAEQMTHFVAHKRMQGFDYTAQESALRFFDRHLFDMDSSDDRLHIDCFTSYVEALLHLKPATREARLGVVHQFSLYLNAFDPESRVMPLRLLPVFARNIRFFRITPEQIGELMGAAEKLAPKGGIRATCVRVLIGLLYTTGLRISEATNLNLGDIDFKRRTLFIHRGKFGKDRLIALSSTTCRALKKWLELRAHYAGDGSHAPLFVVAPNKRLTPQHARRAFRRVCAHCNLQGDPPPRLHDLRHNYACQCLLQWRAQGKDVQALLPVLSTAMGHVNPAATQHYIHIDAATLHSASAKLHTRFIQPSEDKQ